MTGAINGNGGACGLNGPYFRNAVAAWNEDGFLVAGEGPYAFITDAPDDGFTYVRDGLTKSWVRAFTQLEADQLYVGEAPRDGREYARRGSDRTWVPVEFGIPDAPHDLFTYGRHDGEWVVVLTQEEADRLYAPHDTVSFPEAPQDDRLYARGTPHAWHEITSFPEAPEDHRLYGREDRAWHLAVPEAPDDTHTYGRHNFQWRQVIEEAPFDQRTYARRDADWHEIFPLPPLPPDQHVYAIQNQDWIRIYPVPELPPEDGHLYGIRDSHWEVITGGGGPGQVVTNTSLTGNGLAATPLAVLCATGAQIAGGTDNVNAVCSLGLRGITGDVSTLDAILGTTGTDNLVDAIAYLQEQILAGGGGGGGGTITGVTAGTGLSGGGTVGNVTLNLAADATMITLNPGVDGWTTAQEAIAGLFDATVTNGINFVDGVTITGLTGAAGAGSTAANALTVGILDSGTY